MAPHVVVISSSFQSTKIMVTSRKYMWEVLEEACQKLRVQNHNTFGLKDKTRNIDLTQTWGETGLAAGAKLELVLVSSSPSVVSVALRVPESISGGRLEGKFRSDTTFWKILRHFESAGEQNYDFTGRADTKIESGKVSGPGRIYYEEPVLRIGSREISGLVELSKPLAQYGVRNGNILLQLTFRATQKPLEEAMAEITEFFFEEPEEPVEVPEESQPAAPLAEHADDKAASADSYIEDVKMADDPPKVEPQALENQTEVTEAPADIFAIDAPNTAEGLVGRNGRPITVYAAPKSMTPLAALVPHNEMDYEPTIHHAKSVMGRLEKSSQNRQLPSDADIERREREEAAKLNAIGEVMVRVNFPDDTKVAFVFTASDTANDLYQQVKDAIASEDQPFKLGGRLSSVNMEEIPRSNKKLIKDLHFRGRVLLTFMWGDGATEAGKKHPSLKATYLAVAQEIQIPLAEKEEKEDKPSSTPKPAALGGKGGGSNVRKLFPGMFGKK